VIINRSAIPAQNSDWRPLHRIRSSPVRGNNDW
jgi:hypothetical protein